MVRSYSTSDATLSCISHGGYFHPAVDRPFGIELNNLDDRAKQRAGPGSGSNLTGQYCGGKCDTRGHDLKDYWIPEGLAGVRLDIHV
ncbi:uncharacterized protein N7525_002355 [Penicillium rubens]|uniref:uncharacterized protein n=1 Tax=Penicillium rubens TaxID=1108849 RepID=UPI002A599156|nr:uncharacterized protein N7525_002355 [Penicillium rubens]KAJ5844614.1 hypothetical protein N7525_002355 [Penicillium rubens]KAJ5844791.1 hypothetical protein N7534_008460 [Penicillium rubens]